jgi:1-acyl-sn-glycerol-3-phosphate acyltransferase
MKISKLHTLWIIFLSVLFSINTSVRAIIKGFFGTISRPWVDHTLQIWVNRVLKAVKVDYKIHNPHGTKPQPGQPTIIMCNHSSLYDIPLSLKAFPNQSMRMLAKIEMKKIPLLAGAMKASEFPFIDRKNRRQAIKDLEGMQGLLKSGIVMWVAPEGTRSKDGKLGTFKKGAFITAIQAKAIIIPIGIRGAFDILPARSMQFNIHQKAEVHIGEPIDASKYPLEEKEKLMEVVHQAMEKLVSPS